LLFVGRVASKSISSVREADNSLSASWRRNLCVDPFLVVSVRLAQEQTDCVNTSLRGVSTLLSRKNFLDGFNNLRISFICRTIHCSYAFRDPRTLLHGNRT